MARHHTLPTLPSSAEHDVLAGRFENIGATQRFSITPATCRMIASALRFYAAALARPADECDYTVDVWGSNGDRI